MTRNTGSRRRLVCIRALGFRRLRPCPARSGHTRRRRDGRSPGEIRIKFSEGVEPQFSGIALATEAGAAEPTRQAQRRSRRQQGAHREGRQDAQAPGDYTVKWHAVSVDTHKTQGSFNFTVAP